MGSHGRRRLLVGSAMVLAVGTLVTWVILEPRWIFEEWHLHRLRSDDPTVRPAACEALVRMGSVKAVPDFLAEAEKGDNYKAKAARDIIGKLDERGMLRLARRLRREADILHVRAIEARKESESPLAPLAVFLQETLGHANVGLRRYAAEELSRLGSHAACASAELSAASKDESEDVRFWANLALESIRNSWGK